MTSNSESHPRFKTREFWEHSYTKVRGILRQVFIINESRPLKPLEIMALRDEAAAQINVAFPALEVEVLASWIKPLMTDDSIFCGLEFVDPDLFFGAVMASYGDDPYQLEEAPVDDE